MRHYQPFVDPRDEEIKRLKLQLSEARGDLINLAAGDDLDLRMLLSPYDLKTRDDFVAWRRRVIASVAKNAKPDPKLSNSWLNEERAACPLCKSVGNGPYQDGFKLPGGLEWHLEGYGNAHHCPVTAAAFADTRDSQRDVFEKADQAEREAKAHRLATESVLRCDPDPSVKPDLFTMDGYRAERNRQPTELAETEARLHKVGFEKQIVGNVVSYCLTQGDDWMVLADPRERGKVTFHVYKRSGKKTWKGLKKYPQQFDVRDNRKDWSGVFKEGLAAFTGRTK